MCRWIPREQEGCRERFVHPQKVGPRSEVRGRERAREERGWVVENGFLILNFGGFRGFQGRPGAGGNLGGGNLRLRGRSVPISSTTFRPELGVVESGVGHDSTGVEHILDGGLIARPDRNGDLGR